MNFRAQPPRVAGVCRAGLRLLLGLLPCLALAKPAPTSENRSPILSRPYLAVLGSSPLRIQETTPPPDLSAHPPAGAPPQLTPKDHEATSAAAANPPPVETPVMGEPSASETPPIAETPNPNTPPPDPKPVKPVKAILPDDTRPKVRAEDFLPFFQPPGAANPNDVTVAPIPPAPGVQPPSSATYRQQ